MTDYPGGAYHGFAGRAGPDTGLRIERPAQRQFEPDEYRLPDRPRRGVSRGMLLGGVGAAVGLGLLFGLFAKPELGAGGRDREPMRPVSRTAEQTVVTPVPVEVAAVTPAPAPKSAGKLEVLPPELARAAEARAPIRAAPPARTPTVETPAPPVREIVPPTRVAEAPPPVRADPSFNCRFAGTRAERMICGDPELARLDRRLDRAFDRAVASGIPYRELRAEQDDWLSIREDAARRSPQAVESIYRQRIAELDDLGR
ncbi:hypothetical protein ACO2Q0_07270 [Phenylobacterium sp. VNQ135]|uniref:lysozyme inhibitor LprI family protein n=1 Tax=Phenylobacterium sp. VNQ135 TaxID=3400922 RepID=UPI003C01FB4C